MSVMPAVFTVSTMHGRSSDRHLEEYIRRESSKYNSLLRCKYRIEGSAEVIEESPKIIVSYNSEAEYRTVNFASLMSDYIKPRSQYIKDVAYDIRKNYSLLEEFLAIQNADYLDYSEQEYEGAIGEGFSIDFDYYLKVENDLCNSIEVAVIVDYTLTIIVYLLSAGVVIAEKEKSYDIFAMFKEVSNVVTIDKEKEKSLMKECLRINGKRCSICGVQNSADNRVGVIYKKKVTCEEDCNMDNMITICQKCYKLR